MKTMIFGYYHTGKNWSKNTIRIEILNSSFNDKNYLVKITFQIDWEARLAGGRGGILAGGQIGRGARLAEGQIGRGPDWLEDHTGWEARLDYTLWFIRLVNNSTLSTKGTFTYDVRCFLGIFDLPTNPNQMVYYISLFSKIRCSLTYLPTQKSDVICECSLID